MPAAKWSIDKPASRRAQPAVAGRGLSEGLGRIRGQALTEELFMPEQLRGAIRLCVESFGQ